MATKQIYRKHFYTFGIDILLGNKVDFAGILELF